MGRFHASCHRSTGRSEITESHNMSESVPDFTRTNRSSVPWFFSIFWDWWPGAWFFLCSWYIMASGYLRPVVRRPIHSASQLNGWGWAWNSPQRSEVPRKVTGSIWRQRRLGPTPTWKANNLSPRGFPSGRRSSARMPAADSLPILIILFVLRETMNRKKHQINHVLPMPTLSTL